MYPTFRQLGHKHGYPYTCGGGGGYAGAKLDV